MSDELGHAVARSVRNLGRPAEKKMTTELDYISKRYRVRIRRDACGDPVIPGKYGELYVHADGVVGVLFQAPGSENVLRIRRQKAMRAGFRKHQWGDAEAILLFDATDDAQVQLALKLVGVRRKRRASLAQLRNLRRGPVQDPPGVQEP